MRARRGAPARLLGALPSAGRRARAHAGAAPCLARRGRCARAALSALTDPLGRARAYSECVRYEVIVLRSRALHPCASSAPDYDPNLY